MVRLQSYIAVCNAGLGSVLLRGTAEYFRGFNMFIRLSRYAIGGLIAIAISANAQLSAPPATYLPASANKAQVEPSLLLPMDAPSRAILLPTPTVAERAALMPKRATAPSKDGVATKRRRLTIGFARNVAATQASFALADLVWSRTDDGAQAAHISLTSSGAAAIRIGLVVSNAPTALEMRFRGSGAAQAFGPYPANLARESIYWSPVLEGETGVIELTLPAGVSPGAGTVSLPMISHLVVSGNSLRQADPLGQIGSAGACEVDVACLSPTLQQQAATAINAVARMVFTDHGLTGICSGTLINDTTTSFTPYFF